MLATAVRQRLLQVAYGLWTNLDTLSRNLHGARILPGKADVLSVCATGMEAAARWRVGRKDWARYSPMRRELVDLRGTIDSGRHPRPTSGKTNLCDISIPSLLEHQLSGGTDSGCPAKRDTDCGTAFVPLPSARRACRKTDVKDMPLCVGKRHETVNVPCGVCAWIAVRLQTAPGTNRTSLGRIEPGEPRAYSRRLRRRAYSTSDASSQGQKQNGKQTGCHNSYPERRSGPLEQISRWPPRPCRRPLQSASG